MWLGRKMRQTLAIGGLVLAAIFAVQAIENHWFLIPTVLTYGITKLGILLIPWRGYSSSFGATCSGRKGRKADFGLPY